MQVAEVAMRRKASANLGVQRPRRSLDLAGKTLAGCAMGRMAADATRGSRFHAVMACGHSQIVDGSTIVTAHKVGRIVKCTTCTKADGRAMLKARARAKRLRDG